LDVDSAVLTLVWGDPVRVLVVRKSCSVDSYWACDVALPGGSIEVGEDPVATALREAWEESYVHPSMVEVLGVIGVESAAKGLRRVAVVLARPKGPIDPRPSSSEVDFVGWINLDHVLGEPREVRHPRRGVVLGFELPGGLVLWGFTMRVLRRTALEMRSQRRSTATG
jgi:8-oxo-dGTP pyrophosphatase MutT (NUDIX family)